MPARSAPANPRGPKYRSPQRPAKLLGSALLLAATAQAQTTYDWTSATASSWGTATNWTANGIPTANDTANFTTAGSTATITLDDNRQIKVLSFTNANTTWTLNEGALSGAKLNITDGDATSNESNLGVSATVSNTTLNLNIGLGSFSGSASADEAVIIGTNGTVNLTKAFTQRLALGSIGSAGTIGMVYNLDSTDIVKSRLYTGFNNTSNNVPLNPTASTTVNVNASQTTLDDAVTAGGLASTASVLVIRNDATWTQNGSTFSIGFSGSTGTFNPSHGRLDVGVVGDSIGNLTITGGGGLAIGNRAGTGILNINNGTLNAQVFSTNNTGFVTLGASAGSVGGNGTLNLKAGGTLITARNFVTSGTGTGTFNFDGGLLKINRATGNVVTDLFATGITVNVLDGGARIDTQAHSPTINRPLFGVGTGGLEKLGTGTLTLAGQSTYKGDTLITNGVIAVNGNSLPDNSALRLNGATSKVDVAAASEEIVGTLYFDGVAQAFGTWGSTTSTATHQDDTRFSGSGILYSVEAANDQSFVWSATGLSGSWKNLTSWTPTGIPAATDSAAFTTAATAPTINLDGNREIKSLTFTNANTTWNIEEGSLSGARLNFTDGDATGNEDILATVNLTHTTLNLNATLGAFAGSSAADEVVFILNNSTINLSKPLATRTGLGASEAPGATDATYNVNAPNIIASRFYAGFNESSAAVPQNAVASTFVRINADQTSVAEEIRVAGGTGSEFGVLTLRNNATWTQSGSVLLIGHSGSTGTFNRSQGLVEVGETGSAGSLIIGTGGNLIVGERGGLGILDVTNGTLTALADADTDKIGLGWTGSALDGGGDGIINLNTGGTLVTSRQFLRNATALANNTGSGTFYFNGGLLRIDAPQPSALTDLFSDGITLNIAAGARIDTNGHDVTILRAIGSTGSGSLQKLGLGKLTLGGANTYTGNTLITAGTLEVSTDDVFADASTVEITSGATLSLTHGGTDQIAALVINGVPQATGVYAFGTGNLQVGAVATNDYAAWATANSVTGGAEGDSDNDGVKNLIEYALIDGGERGTFHGTPLTLTFTKRGAPYGADLTYTIETSTNLSNPLNWTPVATPPVVNDATKIEYTLPTPTPSQPRIFARLVVTKAP